jgi:hypothetical protein
MARFAIEANRYFSHARAARVDTAGDLTHTYNRGNGLDSKLRAAGHARAFHRDADLLWIETHGGHDDAARVVLYDTAPAADWDHAWVMAYACDTVDRERVAGLWPMVARMHVYCGAWDLVWDGTATGERGEDVGEHLVHGQTVSASWHDGVSDWWTDNHPITVCAGDAATWNGGAIRWERSILNRDHLWGHGAVEPDLAPARQACLLWCWTEG